jgi:ferredoxin
VEVVPNSSIAYISEELCIGCGICVKVSPSMDLGRRRPPPLLRPLYPPEASPEM